MEDSGRGGRPSAPCGNKADPLGIWPQAGEGAGKDADLARDADLVRASALDALGRRDEALALLRPIDAELRPVIAALGSPRVRTLMNALETPA